jgi:alcohol dehydrogenase class IV
MARIAAALGGGEAAAGLYELAGRLGAPRALRELGMPAAGIAAAAAEAVENPYWNPRPVVEEEIAALLRRAWDGAPPRA